MMTQAEISIHVLVTDESRVISAARDKLANATGATAEETKFLIPTLDEALRQIIDPGESPNEPGFEIVGSSCELTAQGEEAPLITI